MIVVGVHSTSLNYRDLMTARRAGAAVIPLSDGAGEVLAVGKGVTRVSAGGSGRRMLLPVLA